MADDLGRHKVPAVQHDDVFSFADPPHLSGKWTGPVTNEEDGKRQSEARRIWIGALVGLGLGLVVALIFMAVLPDAFPLGWVVAVGVIVGTAAGAVTGLVLGVPWRIPAPRGPRRPSDAA